MSTFNIHDREEILKAMLQRENDLRRAPETQMTMEQAEESAMTEWMDPFEDNEYENF